ncbi:SacI homology domain-containing protein [Lactifluus volemus]|nr:SacI homology domain-containing protein [Lactifluus volemus]
MKRLFFSKSSKDPPSVGVLSVNNDKTPTLPPKFVVPPIPHPRPHEHIAVLPTQEGLFLRPHTPFQGESDSHYVRITWGKVPEIVEFQGAVQNTDTNWAAAVIVYGIVGILELFAGSYLLVITSRLDVGHILDESRKIYAIKEVTAIPLSGVQEATSVTSTLARNNVVKARRPSLLVSPFREQRSADTGERENRVKFADDHEIKVMTPWLLTASPLASSVTSSSSEFAGAPVAKALVKRLSFWNGVSRKNSIKTTAVGSPLDVEPLDALIHEGMPEPQQVLSEIIETAAPPPATIKAKYTELEAKIVRQTVKEFSRGEMYFAYDFDITHSLQHKQEQIAKTQRQNVLLAELNALEPSAMSVADGENVNVLAEPSPTLPLWRRLHSYILPLVQGFFQDPGLPDPEDTTHVEYIIMSRRSRDRAGLRYQRRGIDDEAHVANFVETETIARVDRENVTNVFSYVQIRGSIPLFWTQSSAGLKPPPQLSPDATHEQNLKALTRHFQRTLPTYGPHIIVNLAEQHGREGVITDAYRKYVEEVTLPDVEYENISKLVTQLERSFESQGFLWISDQRMLSRQQGLFRVNCIDCLDRTNVVQSAFARRVLNRQLLALAILNPSDHIHTEMDVAFNDVWANNGDAISRSYAGTSALKVSDRSTGKRDLGGLLHDGINSLARVYTSTFSDWFCQAVIDYMLGFRTLSVFSEFLLKLQSTDPRDLIPIATCVSRVLEDGERLLSGWTLFSPTALSTRLGEKFEEKVLLLSAIAFYIISYDYNLEKVKISTRIPLHDIVSITKGAYIVSPLEEASRDPIQNAGFIIEWRNVRQHTRVTSYSMRNSIDLPTFPTGPSTSPGKTSRFTSQSSTSPTRRSALSPRSSMSPGRTCSISAPSTLPTSSPTKQRPASLSRASSTSSRLSRILSDAVPPPSSPSPSQETVTGSDDVTSFAAFKALPIDPARMRRADGSTFIVESAAPNELAGASTCREAVDLMVDTIVCACTEAKTSKDDAVPSVRVGDVVSLAEAQKMTSMYAKMEYGVKRLLWLGS